MNTIILDTETLGNFSSPKVFDLSYLIVDNTHIIKQRAFYIKHQKGYNAFEYNKKEYESRLKSKDMKAVSYKKALKTLFRDMKKYNINSIYAYNIAFDKRVLRLNAPKRFYDKLDKINYCDILQPTRKKLENDGKYICYCLDNGYFSTTKTRKTRIKYKADYVGRFLLNNYYEKHIAIDDCFIEYVIYLKYCW